jgi:hypothetical protein
MLIEIGVSQPTVDSSSLHAEALPLLHAMGPVAAIAFGRFRAAQTLLPAALRQVVVEKSSSSGLTVALLIAAFVVFLIGAFAFLCACRRKFARHSGKEENQPPAINHAAGAGTGDGSMGTGVGVPSPEDYPVSAYQQLQQQTRRLNPGYAQPVLVAPLAYVPPACTAPRQQQTHATPPRIARPSLSAPHWPQQPQQPMSPAQCGWAAPTQGSPAAMRGKDITDEIQPVWQEVTKPRPLFVHGSPEQALYLQLTSDNRQQS